VAAGGLKLCGGDFSVRSVQIQVDGGAGVAMQIDRNPAKNWRINERHQPPGDVQNVVVVARHSDAQFLALPAAAYSEGCGHEESISPDFGF
jgi:hypothetical protein